MVAHLIGNHDQHGGDPKAVVVRDILEALIPRDGVFSGPCVMRLPADGQEAQVAMVKAQAEAELARRTTGWFKRHLSEVRAEERTVALLEAAAKDGLEPKGIVVTFQALQEDRELWASERWPQEARDDQAAAMANVMEEVGELARVHRLHVDHPELDVEALKAERIDGVGDVVIAMARYATACELDLERCVLDTWLALRSRPVDTPRRSYRPEWTKGSNPDATPAAGEDRTGTGPQVDGDGGRADGTDGGWAGVVRSLAVDDGTE